MEREDKRLVAIVVAALAGALGCALLVIAFLLGRITARPPETPRVAAAAGSLPIAGSEPARAIAVTAMPETSPPESKGGRDPVSGPVSATAPTLGSSPVVFESRAEGTVSALASVVTSPGARPGTSPDPERSAVVTYFAEIEQLEEMGGGDPQSFATSMLQSVSSGDFSGFDKLLAQSRNQRDRLRVLRPPPTCVEYHKVALALSSDSVAMLERLRSAISSGDTSALMAIASQGQALEARANQLKSMGEALKQQARS